MLKSRYYGMAHGYTFTSGSHVPGGSDNFDSTARGVTSERHYKGGKMKNWIIDQVNSRQFPGLDWVDKEQSKFKVPWRHAKKKGYNRERDAALFKEWALYTGKYAKHSDPTIWKINFRCALNSLKDIKECKEEHTETFKVYQILPFPHNRKRVQKKDVPRAVSKHDSLANINFGRQPIMPQHHYNSHIDYSSKFQPILPDLESQLRDIDITNLSQPSSNFSAVDSPFSDLMDRPSPYHSYAFGNNSHEGPFPEIPEIVISHLPEITDPASMLESNLSSNISEPSMCSYPIGSNMSGEQTMAELYYSNLNANPESLLELPQAFMHLPVSRSKSMDELNSQLGFNNFDANIYKWRSTGNLGNTPWEMFYPGSGASSMSSLAPEDFMRYFKSEYLSDSGESNSEYHSGNNSYPASNITLPPCPQHVPVEMPLPIHSSISVESESDNLYIDVANDSKFAQEAEYNFSNY